MNVQRGQITCVALIIAVIGAGLGGFLLNAHNVTATNTDYNYITDVQGAFHGSDQDIPVEFNPRENVTGYYAKDIQTDPDYKSILVPSIKYTPSRNDSGEQMPNNYPYTNTRMSVEYYELKVTFTRAHGDEDFATYHCVLTNKTSGDHQGEQSIYDFTSQMEISKKFFIDRSQFNWPDIYHWYVSTTHVEGFTHDVGCVVNLSELINNASWLADKHLSFRSVSESIYPTFGAMLNFDTHDTPGIPFPAPTPVSIGNTTWYDLSFENTSRIVTASTETSSINIHGIDYSLSDGWLAWGGVVDDTVVDREYDTSITLNITASTPDESMRYINPNYGVSPQSTYGATTEIVTEPVFSDSVSGDLYLDKTPYWNKLICNAKIWVTIGDENEDWDTIPLVEVELQALAALVGSETNNADNYIKVWSLNQDGTRNTELLTIDTDNDHHTSKGISWYTLPTDNLAHIRWYWGNEEGGSHEHTGTLISPIPEQMSHDGKVQIKDMRIVLSGDTSGESSWTGEVLYLSSSIGDIGTKSMTWNSYEDFPQIDPDNPYRDGSPAVKTWAYVEYERPVFYESEVTYWYNGYNNSKIGQIFSTKQTKSDIPSNDGYLSTVLNLKLHVQQDNDYWIYDDASKMSIKISTDQTSGMVYIGGLNADGTETQKKQIGNCEHVYVEFSVDKDRRLTMYQCPIYQFTNFLNFELMPGVNYTEVLPEVYRTQDCKSITQMSYYVPYDTTPSGHDPTYMPQHLVTSTTILLDAGGQYVQDGELSLKDQFPQYTTSEFIVNAVVHPGDSMSLISNGTVLTTIGNDGVDKWIYNSQSYDWWDLKVFYAGNSEGIWIEGKQLVGNHVYIQQGRYAPLDDIGALDDGNLTIKMNGVWAFSTQYYDGQTSTTTTVVFDEPGTWHWSKEEFMVVFMGILALSSAIMYFRFGFNVIDLLVFGGQTALMWVMF